MELVRVMFVLFVVAALAGFMIVLRWEHRHFAARGLVASWRQVRLGSVLVLPLTMATVVIPARSVSGMEGLAVFYMLLLSVAPVVWFGLHWAFGRLARPPLAFADSVLIAASPLVYAATVAALAPHLQSLAWSLRRWLGTP
jgi:hypothetical protein